MPFSLRPLAILICLGSALLVVLLWAATLYQLRSENERAIEAALREADNRAIAYEQYVARTLEAAEVAAVHLAERFGREPMPAAPGAPPRRLVAPVAAHPLFTAVIVTDARGDIRWTTFDSAPPLNVASRPAFLIARDEPRPRLQLSRPGTSPILHEPLVALTYGMRDARDAFAGTAVIQIAIAKLVEFNEGAATRPLDLISVARSDGITLARRTGQRITYGEDLRGTAIFRRAAASEGAGFFGPTETDGVPRYFSVRRLERFPAFVTVAIAEEDALREARERRLWYLAGLTALSFMIGGFAVGMTLSLRRRARAARAIAEANARLRKAQEIGRIGDWEYDPASDRMYWSDQLCILYGRDCRDDAPTRAEVFAQLDPPSREALAHAMTEVMRTGKASQCEVRLCDGRQAWHRLLLTAKLDATGRPTGVFGTEQDISGEKAHEQLRDEVARLARVDAVNSMAATIAHELAQPLTAASNYLRGTRAFASRGGARNVELVQEGLDEVERQIGFAREVMRRAREMVAGGSIGYEEAPVADIVGDAVAMVKASHPQAATRIVLSLAPDADCVAAKRVQVQQVLMNLLRNALEAVADRDDGKVVVTARRMSGWMIRISVEDNGPGIAAEVDDIFSPFATSKEGGLGLGLSICRSIIASHRGEIWAERRPEGGTTLCFTLPAARRRRPADQSRAA